MRRSRLIEAALPALVFASTLAIRVRGVSEHFLLLGDQIRDWAIALRPITELPLVGPATHVHGYTVGPAFYWILWAIRVTLGPWFQNLPHAGGIGQAILQSAADALLLVAVWRRTGSVWPALATVVLVATASFDLALSALVWNPVMGSTLAKATMALVLLDWHRASLSHMAVLAAVAWAAVQAYTGAIYVTVGVLIAAVADPLLRRDHAVARRNAAAIAAVIVLLQVPFLVYQVQTRYREPAMDAVTGSLAAVLTGSRPPEWTKSVSGYLDAVGGIQVAPFQVPAAGLILLACGLVVAVKYRRDPVVLGAVLVPQAAAIVGYALFLGALDRYYYLSLMPAAVLTVVLAVTAVPFAAAARAAAIAMFLVSLAVTPSRLWYATIWFRMPEYRVLLQASRTIAGRGQPMRAIRIDFALPPTNDPEFMYVILGGRLDRQAPWVAVISADGSIRYDKADGV